MNYTCLFSEITAANPNLVGDIGVTLYHLAADGLPIAPGFCITANAYGYLMKVTGLNLTISEMLKEANFEDDERIEALTLAVRDLIEQQPIPTEIASEVLENYFALGQQLGFRHLEALPVVVRPSIMVAGSSHVLTSDQLGAYLNIQGGYSTLRHARLCWASFWNTQAVKYLQNHHLDCRRVKIAVVVQALTNSDAAQRNLNAHTFA
jgi:pyruvate, water dikinase